MEHSMKEPGWVKVVLIGGAIMLLLVVMTAYVKTSSAAPADPVIATVGDIACASFGPNKAECHHEAVANLIPSRNVNKFLPLGDVQYPRGELSDFNNFYGAESAFGNYKSFTRPVPGNHEYGTTNAQGYKDYFGAPAWKNGTTYYSYKVNEWRLLAIDSNCGQVGCGLGSPQAKWLHRKLNRNSELCTVAYWHHPRWNAGGEHGDATNMSFIWNKLYRFNVDVVLSGHEHSYQAFQPLNKSGNVDNNRGIREFVVGTGGKSHYGGGGADSRLEQFNNTDYGMMFMTLGDGAYTWEFVNEAGDTMYTGADTCH